MPIIVRTPSQIGPRPLARGRNAVLTNPEEQILIPPQVYIHAVRKLLTRIDLDICSTARAQTIIDATNWYDAQSVAASLAEPWHGHAFLQPHPNSKLARAQIQKLLRDYLCERVIDAVLLLRNLEIYRVEPLLFSFPFVLHYKRMPQLQWSQQLQVMKRYYPPFPTLTIYLPRRRGVLLDDERLAAFASNFRQFGRPLFAENLEPDWEQDALIETSAFRPKPLLTRSTINRYDTHDADFVGSVGAPELTVDGAEA